MIEYQIGRYACTVSEQAFTETKNGDPMITFKVYPEFAIQRVVNAAGVFEEQRHQLASSRPRTIRLAITSEKQQEFVLKKLRYAGFTGDSFATMNLEGAEVFCECKHERRADTGEMTEAWDLALPPGKPLESKPGVASRLDDLFGRKLKDTATASNSVAAAGVAGRDDDDIPFALAAVAPFLGYLLTGLAMLS